MVGFNITLLPVAIAGTVADAIAGDREGAKEGLKLTGMLIADTAFQVMQSGGPRGVASRIAADVQRSVEDRIPVIPATIALGCAAKGVREAVQGVTTRNPDRFINAGLAFVVSTVFALETFVYPLRSRS